MVLCNFNESRLSKIEVLSRRIAPASVVLGQSVVRGPEVGRSYRDCCWKSPPWFVDAFHLVGGAAGEPAVEEGRAEGCSVAAKALFVEISITARSS